MTKHHRKSGPLTGTALPLADARHVRPRRATGRLRPVTAEREAGDCFDCPAERVTTPIPRQTTDISQPTLSQCDCSTAPPDVIIMGEWII